MCDHVIDCGDKSDEGVCSCESGSHFRCTSGTPAGHNNHHSNGSNIRVCSTSFSLICNISEWSIWEEKQLAQQLSICSDQQK